MAKEFEKTRKNLDISYFYFSLSGFLIETFRHPKKSATERKFITLLVPYFHQLCAKMTEDPDVDMNTKLPDFMII